MSDEYRRKIIATLRECEFVRKLPNYTDCDKSYEDMCEFFINWRLPWTYKTDRSLSQKTTALVLEFIKKTPEQKIIDRYYSEISK